MIPQSFIQELLARVDIVDVVGRAVKLKKAGANLQGLCPFHNEKTPSFSVSPTKQFYHCFGCGAHGSAINFLMEHHGLGFVEAVRELAQEVGLEVPQGDRRENAAAAEKARQQLALADWMEKAATYYQQRLRHTPAAIDYLKARGLDGRTARHFGIGYAPAGWRNLEGVLPDYAAAEAVECGLVIAADEGKRYDRFRERVMFPIRNQRGRVIGFGGRVLGQGEPKYLNSPEGPLFSKGRELYGLWEARDAIRAAGKVLVVEGYMDVVMLHQHGCPHVVAALGTAATAHHLQKLMRVTDRIVFAFDGDAAGRRAAWRALENALPMLSDSKRLDFLFLPPEHDPDSFVRAEGLAAFEQQVESALSLSSFLMRELAARGDADTPDGRARMQAALKPLVQQMPDIALRTQLMLEMAGRLNMPPEALFDYCGIRLVQQRPDARNRALHGDGGRGAGRAAGGYRDDGRWEGPRDAWGQGGWSGPRSGAGQPGQAAGDQAGGGYRRGGQGGVWQGQGRGGSWAPDAGRWREQRQPGAMGRPDGGAGGRGSLSAGGGGMARSRPQPLSLQQRVCLLLAYHPGLAREPLPDERFLPEALLDWREQLATLPEGANYADVLSFLRPKSPALADFIEEQDERDAGGMAAMAPEQAREDYRELLARIQLNEVRRERSRLASSAENLEKPEVKTRYGELEELDKRLSRALEGLKKGLSDEGSA